MPQSSVVARWGKILCFRPRKDGKINVKSNTKGLSIFFTGVTNGS